MVITYRKTAAPVMNSRSRSFALPFGGETVTLSTVLADMPEVKMDA